jgi:NAD(P)-dependent dehydrogenase (short-subunit alcohol dehydrogenase family)
MGVFDFHNVHSKEGSKMKPLNEQVILITGATDGLGKAVATELAHQGATMLLHGRSEEKGQQTLAEIQQQTGNEKLHYYRADFARLSEARHLATQIQADHPQLDVLVNNAGLGVEPDRHVSHDGYELTFQVDYLVPFLLTHLLEPLLIHSAPSRIINVSSAGQAPINFQDVMLERHYDGVQAYCQAKLAEVMMTFDLASNLQQHGVTVNCLHPASYMPTKIVVGMFATQSSIRDGVRSVVRLVASPELEHTTGRYFFIHQESRANAQAYDEQARARLRALAEKLTATNN